ncbi:hypothetical protein K7432_004964 [Basidiobolus ranarum]|uniref:Uncharacterized protein n=1 Tax=Basidiobolus ranarum TaxID=34480 RepID=A0ABR2W3S4_9FUNG
MKLSVLFCASFVPFIMAQSTPTGTTSVSTESPSVSTNNPAMNSILSSLSSQIGSLPSGIEPFASTLSLLSVNLISRTVAPTKSGEATYTQIPTTTVNPQARNQSIRLNCHSSWTIISLYLIWLIV